MGTWQLNIYKCCRWLEHILDPVKPDKFRELVQSEWEKELVLAENGARSRPSPIAKHFHLSEMPFLCAIDMKDEVLSQVRVYGRLYEVTDLEWRMLHILTKAFPKGVSQRDLGDTEPQGRRALRNLRTKDVDFQRAIILPGKKGEGGYRIGPWDQTDRDCLSSKYPGSPGRV